MKFSTRDSAIVLMLASLAWWHRLQARDKAVRQDRRPTAAADGSSPDATAINGLEQTSRKTSMRPGQRKSLEPIRTDRLRTLSKAIKSSLAGEKPLMDETQATQVRAAFMEHLQVKRMAEAQAKAKTNLAEGEAFLAANTKKPEVKTTQSGLQYQVLSEGKGAKPKASDTVRVHYAGTLLDGKTFDSSIERGEPVEFPLDQVVPGWQEGIQLMAVGSKYKFWIPSKLGYGEQGTPGGPIGPNAVLVFEVELLDIVKKP